MWEEEKQLIRELGIQCMLPLQDEESLAGIVLLASKKKGKSYGYDDLNFLESVSSIASIAAVSYTHLAMMQGERMEILTALEAFVRIDKNKQGGNSYE